MTVSPFLIIRIIILYSQIMERAEKEPKLLTNCIICHQPLEGKKSKPFVKNPTLDGIKTILNAAQQTTTTTTTKL